MAISELKGYDKHQSPERKVNLCGFCSITEGLGSPIFKDLYSGASDILNIPHLPDSYIVVQDLAPVAEEAGHLLLMPKEHHISLATIEDQPSLSMARDAVLKSLRYYYPNNPILTFEHGPGFITGQPVACGGCHLDHAHGHFLLLPEGSNFDPIQARMLEELQISEWENVRKGTVLDDIPFKHLNEIADIQPYIHLGMVYADNKVVATTFVQKAVKPGVESQLIRRIVAELVYGQTNPSYYNWRDIADKFSADRLLQLQNQVAAFRSKTSF